MSRKAVMLAIVVSLSACNGGIYVRDGVTDGDTFYLAERALRDDDPVLQSWVSYSLTSSACKLRIGGRNPARASSFDCELSARRDLLDTWGEHRAADPSLADTYLDALGAAREAGWLEEYVVHYHGRRGWTLPDDLDLEAFRAWRKERHPELGPETRLVGSWNYARNVRGDRAVPE